MMVILHRYKATKGLYTISLIKQDKQPVLEQIHKSSIKAATNILYSVKSKINMITYYHKYLLSPAKPTWIEEIKKVFFIT